MKFTMESEQEVDGRWIAEVPELPGVLSYGQTAHEAMALLKCSPCGFLPIDWKTIKTSHGTLS